MSRTHIDRSARPSLPTHRRVDRSLIGSVMTVALAALAACSSSNSADGPSTNPPVTTPATTPTGATTPAVGRASFSVSISEPASIDPGLSQEVEGAQVTRLLFETLVTLSPDLELTPGVATDWGVGDDGIT